MPNQKTRAGQIEFLKINVGRREWRDTYHWVLSRSWFGFVLLVLTVFLGINVIFGVLYTLGGNSIYGLTPGSFEESFFFSVQTLATVGYGHMYPQTLYGHVVTTIEIVAGMFGLALMTGLIFVRFSRPKARVIFSKWMVIAPFNGKPTLMFRVANLRSQFMVEAKFRVLYTREESILEGGPTVRRFYPLKLEFDRAIVFPAALTLRHVINEKSPLFNQTPESLQADDAFFIASVVGVETVLSAAVHSQKDYTWEQIIFEKRFVDIWEDTPDGKLVVDYGRLDEIEPAPFSRGQIP